LVFAEKIATVAILTAIIKTAMIKTRKTENFSGIFCTISPEQKNFLVSDNFSDNAGNAENCY